MPTALPAPDIEIYLQAADSAVIKDWLEQRFSQGEALIWRTAGKKSWKTTLTHQDQHIPVQIIEGASPGFVFQSLGGVIRATVGSWQEGDDPDLWWEISDSGECELHWPG